MTNWFLKKNISINLQYLLKCKPRRTLPNQSLFQLVFFFFFFSNSTQHICHLEGWQSKGVEHKARLICSTTLTCKADNLLKNISFYFWLESWVEN